jgi:lysophospholipase L1-like esterase
MENNLNTNRRGFIKYAALAGTLSLSIPEIVKAAIGNVDKKITLKEGDIILFQGDSITDSYRKREELRFNDGPAMGTGYAFLSTSQLLYHHPGKRLKIYNRGISGHKTFHLIERWERDTIDLKPSVLSILVGVNDFWVKNNGVQGTLKSFRENYQILLDKTRQNLPDTKLIIGEPFGVTGIKGKHEFWDPEFKDYQKVVAELARSFDAVFIPYQKVFDKAQQSAPGVYWTRDGVHPTIAGSQLMAEAWLSAIKS